MTLNFGKSCESTRPTGSRLALTTIRSSMLRWLKIFSASTASAVLANANRIARHHSFKRPRQQIPVARHVPAQIAVGENAGQFAARIDHAQRCRIWRAS